MGPRIPSGVQEVSKAAPSYTEPYLGSSAHTYGSDFLSLPNHAQGTRLYLRLNQDWPQARQVPVPSLCSLDVILKVRKCDLKMRLLQYKAV